MRIKALDIFPFLLGTAALCCFLSAAAHCAWASSDPPFKLPPRAELSKIRSGAIITNKGTIYFELFPTAAPWHVTNLKYLADRGYYQNVKFNFHEPGYLIQAGGPGPKINSGPGYTLPPEFNDHQHEAGTLSMVRKPNFMDIEHERRSHGCQFRILLSRHRKYDGYFTPFGKVIKGLDVAQQLRKGDLIKNLIVYVSEDGT